MGEKIAKKGANAVDVLTTLKTVRRLFKRQRTRNSVRVDNHRKRIENKEPSEGKDILRTRIKSSFDGSSESVGWFYFSS